jgi:hypothetical protein
VALTAKGSNDGKTESSEYDARNSRNLICADERVLLEVNTGEIPKSFDGLLLLL